MEEWRDVPGYAGALQASDLGRIRRIHVLAQRPRSGTGYLVCGVPGTGTKHSKNEHVHALVAAAFLGERPAGLEINHKDGNRENPRPDNLEYVTRKENVRDAVRRRMACLTGEQIAQVDELYYVQGQSCRKITLTLGLPRGQVSRYIQLCRIEQGRKKGKWEHKLTKADAHKMRELYAQGVTMVQIAKMYEVSNSHVSRIVRGEHYPE